MTDITIERRYETYTVKSKGHADTPEVCAAISALLQALQGWAHNPGIRLTVERVEPGDCELTFFGQNAGKKRACESVCDLMCVGFLRLHATAPEQIKVTIKQ